MPSLLPGLVPLPDLDDRTWSDLVDEARGLIPGLDPGWTDHGPTDPGMVLVELLAWLTEMLVYRVDRVPEASVAKFVKLLTGAEPASADDLEDAVAGALAGLRERYRAVTAADYERLAVEVWPSTPEASALDPSLAPRRALAVPRLDLGSGTPGAAAPGWISLVVVPPAATPLGAQPPASGPQPLDGVALAAALKPLVDPLQAWTDGRRLAGTRVRVVGPQYVEVGVSARLTLREGADSAAVSTAASTALLTWFDPLAGGPDGSGWSFGRDVSRSDVLRVLRSLADVQSVTELILTRALTAGAGPDLVVLEPYELPWLKSADLTTQTTDALARRVKTVLVLDGSAYVQLPAFQLPAAPFTIEAWAFFDELAGWARVVDFGNQENPTNSIGRDEVYLSVSFKPKDLAVQVGSGSDETTQFFVGDALSTNRWIHLAVTVDDKQSVTIYENGEPQKAKRSHLISRGALPADDQTTAFGNVITGATVQYNYIGRSNWWKINPLFKGRMTEIRIWSYCRRSGEIGDDMNRRARLDPRLYIYWPLDGDLKDRGRAGVHGTPQGNVQWQEDATLPLAQT